MTINFYFHKKMYSLDNLSHLDKLAVEKFLEYLRIPSVHPDVNYESCVTFLENYAKELNLEFNVYRCFPKKPVVILTWRGTEPHLSTILVNSHMDVVPVFEERWTYKPFSAHIDDEGNIHARGSQDTKCLGIQYLEAIRRLHLDKVRLKRTIHVSFVPDEETGGLEGMKAFVQIPDFKSLNVGFALDEGAPSPNDDLFVFPSEKYGWKFAIHCSGSPGHGAMLLDNTAGEKVQYLLNKFYELRKQSKVQNDTFYDDGNVISVNLTMMQGGVQNNVLPSEFVIVFDTRIPPFIQEKEWENTLTTWCKEAGEGVWIEYQVKDPLVESTKLDESSPFWMAFKNCIEKKNNLHIRIMPACTDARFLREVGVPSIGFSPNKRTTIKAHADNECLNANVFLEGLLTYYELFPHIANV